MTIAELAELINKLPRDVNLNIDAINISVDMSIDTKKENEIGFSKE